MKLLQKIRHSLSLRLLLLFAIAGLVISLLFQGMLGFAIGKHVKHQVAPHLRQYVEYIQQDIGSPPNLERAQQLSAKLPIEIMITSAATNWQSGEIPDWLQDDNRHHTFETSGGQTITYDFEREGVLLRYQQGEHDILIWGKGWQRPNHRRGGLLFGILILLVALGILYYLYPTLIPPDPDHSTGRANHWFRRAIASNYTSEE